MTLVMDNITGLNFSKFCRVCLFECDDMFSIYSELLEDNTEAKRPTIFEILANLSTIMVDSKEEFPTMICPKCINSAHSAYKFQQQCNRSQLLLNSYMNQIKNLKDVEIPASTKDVNLEDLNIEHYSADSSNVPSPRDKFLDEDDLLPSELVFTNDELMKDDGTDDPGEDDCDDLRSCLPLGEDTVDQLIKDNLQVDNLELISPKIRSFNLELEDKKKNETYNIYSTGKNSKETPNMTYYAKEKEDGTLEYECNICPKSFIVANSLRIHLKNHDEDKPFVCTECKKAFKVYGSLMHHTRSHSGEQPYKCKECGKKYKQLGTLKAHMRIHSGSKPFICTICSKGFRQAPDLTYHMRTHTKEKPYMCNICGKTMSMQCHLVQHVRSHTGEKPFKCPECDKAFPSSTRLKRHSITHTTLKPYKCSVCDKSFNRNSTLQVHKRIHVGIKSHICSICDKSFLWAHSLRAHVAAAHPNSTHPSALPSSAHPNSAHPTSACDASAHASESKERNAGISNDATPAKESSVADFGTMTIYSDPSENSTAKESFTVFSSVAEKIGSDSLNVSATGLETFTLYSADSNLSQVGALTLVQ